jgi:hypothetical protein
MRWVIADEAVRIHYVTERTRRGRILISDLAPVDLLAVGDSFTFGFLVPEAENWIARVAALTRLRAVNLAVPATGPWEYNQMLEFGLQSRPRVILYGIFADDIPASRSPAPPGPLWIHRGELWRHPVAYLTHTIKVGLSWSVSLQTVNYLFFYQPRERYAPYRFEGDGLGFMFFGMDYWGPMLDPGNPTVQASLDRLEEAVREADRRARGAGATLVVILIPPREMVYIPVLQSQGLLTREVASRLWSPRFDETYDTIRARLTRRGIRTLDLREGFRRVAGRRIGLYFAVDGHWNEAGNDLASRLVAEYLEEHRDALALRVN